MTPQPKLKRETWKEKECEICGNKNCSPEKHGREIMRNILKDKLYEQKTKEDN